MCLTCGLRRTVWPLQVFLIFGKSGWIGGLVGDILREQGAKFEYATAKLEDRAAIIADIERVRSLPKQQHCHHPQPVRVHVPCMHVACAMILVACATQMRMRRPA